MLAPGCRLRRLPSWSLKSVNFLVGKLCCYLLVLFQLGLALPEGNVVTALSPEALHHCLHILTSTCELIAETELSGSLTMPLRTSVQSMVSVQAASVKSIAE